MGAHIIIACTDKEQCRRLRAIMAKQGYGTQQVHSFEALQRLCEEHPPDLIILDVDTINTDNTSVRGLIKSYPTTSILALSEAFFHPDLSEAVGKYILACMKKPLNEEEVLFWSRVALQNDKGT